MTDSRRISRRLLSWAAVAFVCLVATDSVRANDKHRDATRAAPSRGAAAAAPRFKAVAFDFFALFNPDSVIDSVEQVYPGRAREVVNIWRTRQFEYTWLRTITDRYVDFATVTSDALSYAAHALNLPLTADDRHRLVTASLRVTPWPDTIDAVRRLQSAGVRVVALSNLDPAMIRANVDGAGLGAYFDAIISTDASRTYKPDPRGYRLGEDRLHLAKHEILFVASAGWDAAGAKAFGYPTCWVNRFNQPAEELGARADLVYTGLERLVDFVLGNPQE